MGHLNLIGYLLAVAIVVYLIVIYSRKKRNDE
jgi:hypothetical protein